MILNVTIQVINEVRQGVSATTGSSWKNQDVVVAWPEMLGDGRVVNNYQLCTLHGDEVDRFAQRNPMVGMKMEVDIAFNTRQYNGKVYNSNSLYMK